MLFLQTLTVPCNHYVDRKYFEDFHLFSWIIFAEHRRRSKSICLPWPNERNINTSRGETGALFFKWAISCEAAKLRRNCIVMVSVQQVGRFFAFIFFCKLQTSLAEQTSLSRGDGGRKGEPIWAILTDWFGFLALVVKKGPSIKSYLMVLALGWWWWSDISRWDSYQRRTDGSWREWYMWD